jgi:hypothetical protein
MTNNDAAEITRLFDRAITRGRLEPIRKGARPERPTKSDPRKKLKSGSKPADTRSDIDWTLPQGRVHRGHSTSFGR